MNLYALFCKIFIRNLRPDSFDRYLFIGPHPDDIELGCGAFVSRLTLKKKKRVCFLVCTDGKYGNRYCPTLSESELINVRKNELYASAMKLGVFDVRTLGFGDGGFYSDEDMKTEIAKVISEFKPEAIFVTDPDVISELHPDHLRIGNIVKELTIQSKNNEIMKRYGVSGCDVKELCFYFSAKTNYRKKAGKFFGRKLDAIFNCHLSQFPVDSDVSVLLKKYLKLRRIFKKEESFRVVDKIHMHCFPEADL